MAKNPFNAVSDNAPLLKILAYGNPGTGKTRFGLTCPSPAVVDAENKVTLHAGMPAVSQFSAFPARSLDDLDTAIAFIEEDAGKTYKTLVVDSITVLYLRELERVRMAGSKKVLGYKQRADVNRRMDNVYARLAYLPVHLVVIAREAIEYDDKMNPVGTKPDSGGDLGYTFDMVIRMNRDYSGIVERETGQLLPKGTKLVTVNWQVFADALSQRGVPWHEKPAEIEKIIERAKDYFAPLKASNDIRSALFDVLDIKTWSDLGPDRSAALNTIADKLKESPSSNSGRAGVGLTVPPNEPPQHDETKQKAGAK